MHYLKLLSHHFLPSLSTCSTIICPEKHWVLLKGLGDIQQDVWIPELVSEYGLPVQRRKPTRILAASFISVIHRYGASFHPTELFRQTRSMSLNALMMSNYKDGTPIDIKLGHRFLNTHPILLFPVSLCFLLHSI